MNARDLPEDVIDEAAEALAAKDGRSWAVMAGSDKDAYLAYARATAAPVAAWAREQALEEALAVLLSHSRSQAIDTLRALIDEEEN